MIEAVSQPWPWYVAGPLIGLLVPRLVAPFLGPRARVRNVGTAARLLLIVSLVAIVLQFASWLLLHRAVKEGEMTLTVDAAQVYFHDGDKVVCLDRANGTHANQVLWTGGTNGTTLEGPMLFNRLLWIGISLATITLVFLRFRFAHRVEAAWPGRLKMRLARVVLRREQGTRSPAESDLALASSRGVSMPDVRISHGTSTHLRQMLAFILKGAGYQVVQASSSDEALTQAAA